MATSTPIYLKICTSYYSRMHTVHNLHYSLNYAKIELKSLKRLYAVFIGDYEDNIFTKSSAMIMKHRPLAGYGLPPPRGNFVDHIFLEAQCLARILQHVSPLTMAALSCNSLLHTLPYKIFDN